WTLYGHLKINPFYFQLINLMQKPPAGELCSVPHEPTFYRQISLLAKEKPVEGSPLFLLQTCTEQLVVNGKI
ncbi:hypothetical protein MZE73_17415, partial [Escherichia coli]|nr:hypothetical protein [Escherichia coli]